MIGVRYFKNSTFKGLRKVPRQVLNIFLPIVVNIDLKGRLC